MSEAPALLALIEASRDHLVAQAERIRAGGGPEAELREMDQAAELSHSLLAAVDAAVRSGLDHGLAVTMLRQTTIGLIGLILRYEGSGTVTDERLTAALENLANELAFACNIAIDGLEFQVSEPDVPELPTRPTAATLQ